jgi:signal transduction histidine kinase
MMEPSLPENEAQRLDELRKLRILDTPAEERFDRITRTVGDLFQVPIALITLVDADRQWFKSRTGFELSETPRPISFCAHAILDPIPFVVEDTLRDERFANNPLVAGELAIRFYAGMPLRSISGLRLGTLCIMDRQPRTFDADDVRRLRDLAAWAERELNLGASIENTISEMRETFVKLVSHELRTPVTGIVGALELMNSGEVGAEDINALSRIASDGAGRLTRIVDDIVEIAELDAQQQKLAIRRIDLDVFLEVAMESHLEAAAQHDVSMRVDVPAGLTVMAAQQPLVRILRSLLDNAISYSPPGATIVIAAHRHDDQLIRISITDCGPGIPAEHIPKLFLPFSQADSSDQRSRDGCGISLAIGRRLATAMGGRLGYEVADEGGARFYLDLPA